MANPAMPVVWNPGQHMAVIGMTGQGKSTVIEWLLKPRKFVLILKSKPDDVEYQLTETVKTVTSLASKRPGRYLLEPTYSRQADEFQKAYDLVWKEGGWSSREELRRTGDIRPQRELLRAVLVAQNADQVTAIDAGWDSVRSGSAPNQVGFVAVLNVKEPECDLELLCEFGNLDLQTHCILLEYVNVSLQSYPPFEAGFFMPEENSCIII